MKMYYRSDITFPCKSLPDDASLGKLLGLYPQRQEGLWMQRIKIMGGRLKPQQWGQLAEIARTLTPDTPLHLTTRQELQAHDLKPEQIPLIQQELERIGLTTVGAAGDTPRNVTVCQCPAEIGGKVDLYPLAQKMCQTLDQIEDIYSLPRKFKISFSACEAMCAQPWINCVGFVAKKQDGQWGFMVTAGGSLGAKPGTAMQLFDWLPADDVLPMAVAAVRVFAEHGDRENRRKARLRHVRERVVDDAFATMLKDALTLAKADREWPSIELAESPRAAAGEVVLTFANGDIWPDAADALGELAAMEGFHVRISTHHRVLVFGPTEAAVSDAIAGCEALTQAARPQPAVVACPGKRFCPMAAVNTNEMADAIRSEFGDKLRPSTTVCISGCPNGCAQTAVADIGLSGRVATVDGEKVDAFNLLAGGGMGRDDRLAELVAEKLLPDQVLDEIRKLDFFK